MRTSVLLVEGDDRDASLVTRTLLRSTRSNIDVDRATTLAGAQQQLGRARYDAVVVDLGLPDSDGLATFSAISANAGNAAIIVLASDDRAELGLKAVELGAKDYIIKTERSWQTLPMAIAQAVERARRQQEMQELTAALAKSVDAIATLDGTGFVAVNGPFQSLLGFSSQEIAGTSLLELIQHTDRPRVASVLSSSSGMDQVEARAIRADGHIVPVHLTLVKRQTGRGHFCFVRDLTRQKQVEGSVAAAAAITAVGSLTTGLAHEVNNPLAVVFANVEEASRIASELESSGSGAAKAELADLRSMLEEALEASRRVKDIVRDLRAFACAEDRRGRVDVNAVIETCCNIAIAEIRHRARLVKDLKAATPVRGSEARLAQMFLDLLVNAAHAMPDGDIERNEIHVATRQANRAAIVIEISDTGIGITPAHLDLVFDPFFTTKPRRPGMGLAICRATVAAHGGELSIRAREGGGTIVRIILPTFEAELARDPLAQELERPAPGPRVLVVDDDPLVLRSLTRVLARDFEVASARNGREALDLVRAGGTFDAMLCDLVMPELSGIELHELLERDAPELAKRTVFLTGGAHGRAQTFLEEVGQPHLEKPVDMKTVRELLLQLSQLPHKERSSGNWLGGD